MAININREKTPSETPRVSRRYQVGAMSITSLLDMTAISDGPKVEYASHLSNDEFATISQANFLSSDECQIYMSPTLIDTGSERVLIDTGLGYGGLMQSLKQANVSPESIDIVALSHMHPDHIGGLMTKGEPTFPNARYVAGSVEYNFWSKMEKGNFVGDLVANAVTPLVEKMTFIDDGDDVVTGICAMASFGHSPGHFCLRVESDGEQLLLTADLANHYVWSFAHPEWAFQHDADAEAASASRRNVLSMLATEQIPMIGYHMPFPGVGYVERRDKGFRFVPATYQLSHSG